MAPKKRVLAVVKIQLQRAGQRRAPVGTALGPHGVQTMEFCKQYNAATEEPAGHRRPGRHHHLRRPLVQLRAQDPADPVLLRQAAGIEKGSTISGREQAGTVTDAQLGEIAASS